MMPDLNPTDCGIILHKALTFGICASYLALAFRFFHFLRAERKQIWLNLGKPEFSNFGISNGWKSFVFVFFGMRHHLSDARMLAMVCPVWVTGVMTLILALTHQY